MTDSPELSALAEAIKRLRFNADFQLGYGGNRFSMRRDDADLILAALSSAPVAGEAVLREGETLEQYADRVVAKTRRNMLDRLDDDVIGELRQSHLVFGKACAMEAVWTAMREMGEAMAAASTPKDTGYQS